MSTIFSPILFRYKRPGTTISASTDWSSSYANNNYDRVASRTSSCSYAYPSSVRPYDYPASDHTYLSVADLRSQQGSIDNSVNEESEVGMYAGNGVYSVAPSCASNDNV